MTLITDHPQPLLTARRAALVLNTTVENLAQMRFEGIGPEYLKLGKPVRYELRELTRYQDAVEDRALLTLAESAMWWRISDESLRILRRMDNTVPTYEVGGRLMVNRGEAKQFLRTVTHRPSFRAPVPSDAEKRVDRQDADLRFVPLLTPREAKRIIKKEVGTLENWRIADRGPDYIKLGRSVLYDTNDLIRYIRSMSDRTPISIDEVSAWWGIGVKQVWELFNRPNAPKIRIIERKTRVYRGEVELFLRDFTQTPRARRAVAA